MDIVPIDMGASFSENGKWGFSKLVRSVLLLVKVHRKLYSNTFDAAYITVTLNGFALLRDYLLVLLCKAHSTKRIYHIHMKGARERGARSWFFRSVYRSLFKAAEVIHVSNSLFSDLEGFVAPERFRVVPNGILPPPSEVEVRKVRAVGPSRSCLNVLFLSNMLRAKGALDLLEASLRLFEEGVDHRLTFVGAPRDDGIVEDILTAAKKVGGRIAFAGPLFDADKWRALADADIFVFPTHNECLPLAVIEAMSIGLPIIASREGAIPDLISSEVNGLLFPPKNVDALTDALRRLLLDASLRNDLGQEAKKSYRQQYTLGSFERHLDKALSDILQA